MQTLLILMIRECQISSELSMKEQRESSNLKNLEQPTILSSK
jgi:hypothetical protein